MRLSAFIRYAAFALLMSPLYAFAFTATDIETGSNHNCGLTPAGGVECWGWNYNGQLGDGSTTQRLTPVAVSGLSNGVQAVATGNSHTCALMSTGGVQCWGQNIYGQLGDGTTTQRLTPVAVSGLSSGVQSIAIGRNHACVLTTAGAVKCWGMNDHGQLGDNTTTQRLTPVSVSSLSSDVTALAAGDYHTCALLSTGAMKCWGRNVEGQLGDGTTTQRMTPVAVSGLSSGVQAIVADYEHSCALTTGGGVQCWGRNIEGQLGDGTTTTRSTPVAVSGLSSGAQLIATGDYHTCALTTAGGAVCWGANNNGQLGDGTTTQRLTPVSVSGLSSGVTAMAGGDFHTCALTNTGVVQCWGLNNYGQLGDGATGDANSKRLIPVTVGYWQNISVTTAAPAIGVIGVGFPVAATSSSGLPVAITVSGGCSISGNTVTLISVTPFCTVSYSQSGNPGYIAVSVSSVTSVDTDGDGAPDAADTDDDNDGVLDAFDAMPLDASESLDTDTDGIGNNTDTDDDNDTVLDGSDNCALRANLNQLDSNADGQGDVCEPPAIAAGSKHTCFLTPAGGVECWGNNQYGQLGGNSGQSLSRPVAVSGLNSGVKAIAAAGYHTCALTVAGGVQCWGRNIEGQLGDGTTTNRLTPVAVSGLSSGVQAIATGGYHTCALTDAGAVKCWGNNGYGQLGDGTATNRLAPVAVGGLSSGVQAIEIGWGHSCALTTAGGVPCWGNNDYGQLGDNTTTQRLTPVWVSGLSSGVQSLTAGILNSCALTVAGGALCWGNNAHGQLGDGTAVNRLTPVAVSGLSSGVQALAVAKSSDSGFSHICALTTAGGVKCWGANTDGQLGDGATTQRFTPVAVSGLGSGVQAIAAGQRHSCALTTIGSVWCWGRNADGQLGDNTTTLRLIPVFVVGFEDSDGDGVLDASDAFPYNSAESLDTDHDGIGNNADMDDDNDGVPDYIDADPLNAAVNTERLLPLNSGFKGSSVQESVAPL